MTDRIRLLPVTVTGRFSNFNNVSYTEDRHRLRVTGKKWRNVAKCVFQGLTYVLLKVFCCPYIYFHCIHIFFVVYMYFFVEYMYFVVAYEYEFC